jgi:Rrf2 family protein
MRMSEGVEWAVHSCLALAWLGDGVPVPTARLAGTFELPPAYLNKQLQALAKAGIVRSTPGPRGGFGLARLPEDITLLDVVTAIEGPDEAFQCQEIRQRGIGANVPKKQFREQCAVAAAMRSADIAWRRALAEQTLADVRAAAERSAPDAQQLMREWHATPHSSGT